jgi:hypothetical protein
MRRFTTGSLGTDKRGQPTVDDPPGQLNGFGRVSPRETWSQQRISAGVTSFRRDMAHYHDFGWLTSLEAGFSMGGGMEATRLVLRGETQPE